MRAPLTLEARAPREAITSTYTVNSTGDEPNADLASTSCDTDLDPAAGVCTLRAAVDAANADPTTTDRIVVPAGTIVLTNGQITIASDLLINGAGAASTIVDGDFASRILYLDASTNDATAEITDLTLTKGTDYGNGGAVYVTDNAALTLTGVTLSDSLSSDGGALYADYQASLWLDRTTFKGNEAASDGGAAYINGAAYIVDSMIGGPALVDGNTANNRGGGLYSEGTTTIVNSTVRNNEISTVTLPLAQLQPNSHTSIRGGGIANQGQMSVSGGSISDNRIVKPTNNGYGGGISNLEQLLVTGTTISGNTIQANYIEGVGVYANYLTSLIDTTVSDNVGTVTCAGCDVYGAGVSNEYTLTMKGGALRNNRGQGLGSQSYTDGVTTNESTTFVSAAANFTGNDVGKTITGAGLPSGTTITALIDEATVTLSNAATADASSVAFTIVDRIDAYGYGGGLYNGSTATVTGVTIEGNSLDGMDKNGDTYVEGAAVANEDTLTLSDSTIRNNTGRAEDVYGAIYSDDHAALQNLTISGSVADAGSYVEGAAIDNEDYMTILNVSVADTTATATGPGGDVYGGAVYHYDNEEEAWDGLRISNTNVTATDYIEGGALATEYEIALSNSSISGTNATTTGDDSEIDGGAWYLYYGGVVTNVQVLNTRTAAGGVNSDVYGGAVYVDDDTVFKAFTIDSTVVTAGDEVEGGGLVSYYPMNMNDSSITRSTVTTRDDASTIEGAGFYSDDATSLTNVTIADNSATAGGQGSTGQGGGIWTDSYATLTHVTVAGNSANGLTAVADDPEIEGDQSAPANDDDAGSGIYTASDMTFRGTIVAANTPSDVNCSTGESASASSLHSAGYNLESGDTCQFDTVGDLVNTNPGLVGLVAAGSTFVRPLVPGSAAIDSASNNGCPATDQRGQERPVGPKCDIGAFEYKAEPAPPPPPAPGPNDGGTPPPTFTSGYREIASDGGVFTFGDREFQGSTGDLSLNKPIVGGATDKSTYQGYWMVGSDGGVFAFNAPFLGSLAGQQLSSPATEIEPTPTGKGYWIVLADGKVYTFGDAEFFGDMASKKLNQPVIGMSVTPTGKGYWLVAADGGIFNFGDAGFFGSTGDIKLNAPIIDLAPSVDNQGYYLLGRDGGVFTFGTADFKGSTGDLKLNAPVIAMLVDPTGSGYWLAASDGGIFTFGNLPFLGSMGGTKLNGPVLDLIN